MVFREILDVILSTDLLANEFGTHWGHNILFICKIRYKVVYKKIEKLKEESINLYKFLTF